MNYKTRSLLWLTAACAIAIVVFLTAYHWLLRQSGATATGTSSASANKMLWESVRLPNTANDVAYYVDFGACEAEFSIPEGDFLRWCEDQGWPVEPISAPTPYFEAMWLRPDAASVTRGFHFSPPDGHGVFDRDASRAAFSISTFP